MKVLFFLNDARDGGVQRRTLRLITSLINLPESIGVRFHLHLMSGAGAVPFHVPAGLVVTWSSGPDGRPGPGLSDVLARVRPDVCVACFGRDFVRLRFVLWRLRQRSCRLVAIQAVPAELPNLGRIRNLIRRFAIGVFYPFASRVVCVSRQVEESMLATSRDLVGKTLTIFNPVVGPKLDELASQHVGDAWEGMEGRRLVSVGRLHFQKDYQTLLEAMDLLRHGPAWPVALVIVGEGPDRPVLEQAIASRKLAAHVRLLGQTENPFAIVRQAELFVMSSRWEGLPSALIEAMYLGVNCVSTDCIAGPREILSDGEFGRLVPVGDAAELARAIEISLREPLDKVLIRQRASMFGNDVAAANYLNMFKQLVAE